MSVAFRRESDEEHLEPRFERPIPPGPNYVTPRGRALIDEEIAALEAQVAAADEDARAALARDLRYWQTRAATAVPAPRPEAGEVGIGSRVTFRVDGDTRVVTIVGGDEAEPAAGRIAFSAPVARALMGAWVGERVEIGGRAGEVVQVEDPA